MRPERLLTFDKAAADMGVPVASLRAAADEHGLTIRMGQAVRIRSLIRAALDEGAMQVEIQLKTGEVVKVSFAGKSDDVDLVEWKK